jgi:hypothetical protein
MIDLQEESGRISHLASRWSCRCWIWLAMALVILTFVGKLNFTEKTEKKRAKPLVRFQNFLLGTVTIWVLKAEIRYSAWIRIRPPEFYFQPPVENRHIS